MTRILVTGASGNIGRQTLTHLLRRLPARDVVGLARDPARLAELAAEGIEVRQGDYFDRDGLVRAFDGIDKLMLVSATAFGDRNTQHRNVIDAARQAGVGHIVFMPVIRKAGSSFILPHVTEEDRCAEAQLIGSGLSYTLVAHPPFLESVAFFVGGEAMEAGIHAPGGSGQAGFALRDELAEAHAVVLSEPGHENKSYALYGEPAVSLVDIARILSAVGGKPVPFLALPDQDYIARLVASGLPEPAAAFALAWVRGINAGEWDGKTGDLEKLLGRKPVTAAEFLRAPYTPS